MPPGDVHLQAFPGATTGVVLGAFPAAALGRLPGCRALLWISAATAPAPVLPPGLVLERVSLAEPAALLPALERFLRRDARHLPSVLVGADADPRFPAALAQVTAVLEDHHRARVTRQRDGFRWQRHVLANLGAYARHPLPAAWAGRLAGLPAVICGAGPSLDVSAAALAAAADRVVILAADSALHTLARHGITADLVVSIDVAKEPGKCLPPGRRPARAVLSPVSPPAWQAGADVPSGSCHFVTGNQITPDWLHARGLARPPLAAAENCGVTALVLARWLGCAPLYLCGLDLALAPGAQRHTTGADTSLYTHSGFNAAQDFPEVPGNYAETVPTHAIGDWRALDQRLAAWPAGLVINVNDRGARLANTTLLHPARFVPPPSADKASALARLGASGHPADAATWEAIQATVATAGRQTLAALPALRAALAAGGGEALVPALRQLLRDETIARVLGAYTLKLMPHLLPPIEGDQTFWASQLDELDELARLASANED